MFVDHLPAEEQSGFCIPETCYFIAARGQNALAVRAEGCTPDSGVWGIVLDRMADLLSGFSIPNLHGPFFKTLVVGQEASAAGAKESVRHSRMRHRRTDRIAGGGRPKPNEILSNGRQAFAVWAKRDVDR